MQLNEVERDVDSLTGEAEPWEAWETSLVLWSIGVGIVGLLVFGWFVSRFILS